MSNSERKETEESSGTKDTKDRGLENMSRAGRLNKLIVLFKVDVVDHLGRGVFKEQVWQSIMQGERGSGGREKGQSMRICLTESWTLQWRQSGRVEPLRRW